MGGGKPGDNPPPRDTPAQPDLPPPAPPVPAVDEPLLPAGPAPAGPAESLEDRLRRAEEEAERRRIEADDRLRQALAEADRKRVEEIEALKRQFADQDRAAEATEATPARPAVGWSEKTTTRNRYVPVRTTDQEAEALKEAIARYTKANPQISFHAQAIENLADQLLHGRRVAERMGMAAPEPEPIISPESEVT